jgi:hypothetical protein
MASDDDDMDWLCDGFDDLLFGPEGDYNMID